MSVSVVRESRLRSVRYKCVSCQKVHTMRFALGYLPFISWLMTCPLCRKYTLHRTTERGVVTQTHRWR